MVVLPTPGGPQKISDDKDPEDSIVPKGASGPKTCCWPMTSAKVLGRNRSASGRGPAGVSVGVVSKRSAMMPKDMFWASHDCKLSDVGRLPREHEEGWLCGTKLLFSLS